MSEAFAWALKIWSRLFRRGPVEYNFLLYLFRYTKNGSQLDPNNYRGITVGSCLGKLVFHVINNNISSDLENRCFLKQEQAGFRKNYRTSDNVFVLKTIIDKYVLNSKNGSRLFGCFIDLKKAFDTVWHEGVFLKLQKAGINGKIYNIIKKCTKVLIQELNVKILCQSQLK